MQTNYFEDGEIYSSDGTKTRFTDITGDTGDQVPVGYMMVLLLLAGIVAIMLATTAPDYTMTPAQYQNYLAQCAQSYE